MTTFFPEYVTKYREADLAKAFFRKALEKMESLAFSDVIIVGAGPAGLTAAWLLAEKGFKVLVVEQGLGTGGGIRGGGVLLPVALIEEGEAAELLRRIGVRLEPALEGIYVFNPTEFAAKLTVKAVDAGAVVLPGYHVEDLIVEPHGDTIRVKGVVVNLAPAVQAGWHIDPVYFESRAVVDATGHDAWLARILQKRFPKLGIQVPGMASLSVWRGEREVVEKTGMLVPGLYLAGMSVAEVYNTFRMGPILGGMIASGKKVAELIAKDLGKPEAS